MEMWLPNFRRYFIKIEKSAGLFLRRSARTKAAIPACVLLFAVCSGFLIYRALVLPEQADDEMAKARALYRFSASSSAPQRDMRSGLSREDEEKKSPPAFSELRAANPDVAGWITLPSTVIDYPVLLAPADSPDYYLDHDWQRNKTKYGSVFMLAGGLPAEGRKNTILYGHSMKDGRMFGALLKYESLDFYRSHPTVLFQENEKKTDWKIFAVIKVNTEPSQGKPFDYQKPSFSSEEEFLEYLYRVRVRSIFNFPVDLNASDDLLTLSTCSYEFSGFRTVVFARRVRDSESENVNTGEAAKNRTVLYPDCWYQRFGGKKPSLPTFQDALKSKSLQWLTEQSLHSPHGGG